MKHPLIALDIAGIGNRFYCAGGFINESDPITSSICRPRRQSGRTLRVFFSCCVPAKKPADIAENGMRTIEPVHPQSRPSSFDHLSLAHFAFQ